MLKLGKKINVLMSLSFGGVGKKKKVLKKITSTAIKNC
jgi:hypothetical protein